MPTDDASADRTRPAIFIDGDKREIGVGDFLMMTSYGREGVRVGARDGSV